MAHQSNQNQKTSMQGSGEPFSGELTRAIITAAEMRGADAPPATQQREQTEEAIPYGTLCTTNDAYDAWYWRRLRALYAGGKKLLGDNALMEEVFPPHRNEHALVYAERRKRAFYIPYAGEIIDHIVAALFREDLELECDEEVAEGDREFYAAFAKDCSPPGGKEQSLAQLLREQLVVAQQCRGCWTLVDLPAVVDAATGEPKQYTSRGEQERDGALDAYAVALQPESVIDWECDATGELEWAVVHTVERKRHGIRDQRNRVRERWTYYTRDEWAEWAIEYKKGDEPDKDTPVPWIRGGMHTHGAVPIHRMELPEGLWAMAKLEGPAREHFNKRCALSWAETQSLLPELYEFLGTGENGAVVVGEDEDRATSQVRGQGFVQERTADDRAEFVGPDAGPFDHSLKSCNDLRDEMHRVTHQMALSTDNGAAALARSGESKAQDKAATAVVLVALGKLVREYALTIVRACAHARGASELAEMFHVSGMEKFDSVQSADAVEEAVTVDTLGIESPTFQRRYKYKICKLVLGDDASEEDLEKIEKELEANIPDELFDPVAQAVQEAEIAWLAEGAEGEEGEEGEEGQQGGGRARPPMRRPVGPPPGVRRMGGSAKLG